MSEFIQYFLQIFILFCNIVLINSIDYSRFIDDSINFKSFIKNFAVEFSIIIQSHLLDFVICLNV